jgi:hypothetical protein
MRAKLPRRQQDGKWVQSVANHGGTKLKIVRRQACETAVIATGFF